jgi:hypothetical protein
MKKVHSYDSIHRVGLFTIAVSLAILLGFWSDSEAQQGSLKPDTTGGINQLSFLLGEWVGEGGGASLSAETGGFTYSMDLQNSVMIKKNYADFAASQTRPAFRHEDLTVIYQVPGDTMRAIYFDNEGHVINYTVDIAKDKKSAVFVSPPMPQQPRFRLIQTLKDEKTMDMSFEMAPPGQPDAFSPYITAIMHRK